MEIGRLVASLRQMAVLLKNGMVRSWDSQVQMTSKRILKEKIIQK